MTTKSPKTHDGVEKKRAITYNRDCEERVEYWVINQNGSISKCAPTVWHRINLPDTSSLPSVETAARLRYKKVQTQFNKQVDDNTWLRTNPPLDAAKRYQHLCDHLNIIY